MSIEPYNRAERILSGEDLEPTTRLEYFMKEAASGGGGGGGGTEYDLVLRCESEGMMAIPSITTSDYSIVSGSAHDFVAKFESGGIPNAILYCYEYDAEYNLEGYYSINRLSYFYLTPYPSEGEGEVHFFFNYIDYNNDCEEKVMEVTMFEKTNTIYSAIRH